MERVIEWAKANNFSTQWQETLRGLDLCGLRFLELGTPHTGRGNFGLMHQRVYPRLCLQYNSARLAWDVKKEREEGKRLRRMIRSIITGKPIDPAKSSGSAASPGPKESISTSKPSSAGPDSIDSPNVSMPSGVFLLLQWLGLALRLWIPGVIWKAWSDDKLT